MPFGSRGIVSHCCLADAASALVALELSSKYAAAVAALMHCHLTLAVTTELLTGLEGSYDVAINFKSQYHCSSCRVFDSELVGRHIGIIVL